MLEVELDIFSGMPNPTWILSKRQEKTLVELLSAEPSQISPVQILSNQFGLGYRGLIVRRIKTDEGVWDKAVSARRAPFPNEFRIGIKADRKDSAADWLVKTASRQGTRLADEVQAVVSRGLARVPRSRGPVSPRTKSIANVSRKQKSPSTSPTNLGRRNTRHGGRVVPTISARTHTSSTILPTSHATTATASPATICPISLCFARQARRSPGHVDYVRRRD